MKIVERQPLVINDIAIHERAFDGYINATAMCQAGKKQLKHFFENDRTKLFLQSLERSVGIPTNLLVQSTVKGKNETRGTWVHPRVAISLAMWISPDFEVKVTEWIFNGVIDQGKKDEKSILQAYIAQETREWSKTFPDVFWQELGRLDNWPTPLGKRPQWWGKLVVELIYDTLEPEVTEYLKKNKPISGIKWHQNLTDDIGVKALVSRCYQIAGMATVCRSIDDLRKMVSEHYGRKPVQTNLKLYLA